MLERADVMIFFMNEFTLKDAHCLLLVQEAVKKKIPLLMLKPPKTKLLTTDEVKNVSEVR